MTNDKRAQVLITANIPHELFEAFLHHIRMFDTDNPGCAFNIVGNTDYSTEEMNRILDRVEPGLPLRATFSTKKN